MLHARLQKHLNRENILLEQQHGFRHRRSSETAVAVLIQKIFDSIDKPNTKAFAVFVDLRSASPSINRLKLLIKLSQMNVSRTQEGYWRIILLVGRS
jgi:hypothetical protein